MCLLWRYGLILVFLGTAACSTDAGRENGAQSLGGSMSSAGDTPGSGGSSEVSDTGGTPAAGGAMASGGGSAATVTTGGIQAGGTSASAGGTGGTLATGGQSEATGGNKPTGGMPATGGFNATGGTSSGETTVGQGITLEAEDYVAGHDTSAGNSGNCYRTDDVDIESCSEGGFNVAWIESGEWLEYDFVIDAPDTFNIVARTATPFGNSAGVQYTVDGRSISGWLSVPMTHAWQDWQDVVLGGVSLTAGKHRLHVDLGGNFNLDYFYVVSATNPPDRPAKVGPGAPPSAPAGYVSPVSRHGQLKVVGTSLRDAQGQSVQLRGMSTHGLQWFPPVAKHTVLHLAYDWGISIIRPAMYVEDIRNGAYWGGYLAQPEYMQGKVIEAVEDALAAGVYVILDWHIHNNPANFTTQAIAYFRDMASRYGSHPNILYEICNEPEYVDWSVIKAYALILIKEIRSIDPNNIIIVGTPNWSQYVDVAASDRIPNDTNVVYALHFYAAEHKDPYRQRAAQALAAGLPIFVSEWGTTNYSGGTDNVIDLAESQIWLDWLNARNVSWLNWSFSSKGEASATLKPGVSLAGPWLDSDLTQSGLYVRSALVAH